MCLFRKIILGLAFVLGIIYNVYTFALILQELDIRVNDTLSMEVRGEQIIIEKVKFKHRTLEERARAYDGKLGPYTEFDWGEPKGREVW